MPDMVLGKAVLFGPLSAHHARSTGLTEFPGAGVW
jgi:hypothetical protein